MTRGPRHAKEEWFIIGACLTSNEVDFIMAISSHSAEYAHERAAKAYRKQYDLLPSRHVFTSTLLRGESNEVTMSVYDDLMKKLGQEMSY